jgi:poly(3-hydroxybutyrate) depolymerase
VSVWQSSLDTTVLGTNAREIVEQWTNVHGIDAIPDIREMVKGYPHLVYTDANGRALVESYVITGMGHGTPVDPGPAEDQCGALRPFIIDANICASYYIALFWGLDKGGAERPLAK